MFFSEYPQTDCEKGKQLLYILSIIFLLLPLPWLHWLTSIFSEKISPANDGLFVLDGLFVHEGLYVYVQLTYKKAWIL